MSDRNIDLLSSPSLSGHKAAGILASPELMAGFFRRRLSQFFPANAELTACVPKVLMRRVRTRQVVAYRLVFSGIRRPLTLILKRYADKNEGKRVYSTMQMLWKRGFDQESKLTILEPLSYLEDLGILITEEARGVQLREKLNHSGPSALTRMKAIARWLTKLHHLNIDLDKVSPHASEGAGMRAFARHAAGKAPALSARIEVLVSAILKRMSAFRNIPRAPVHGDFQCGNIFIHKNIITVIDFDKFCSSDPARDPGYMISHMRTTAFREAVPDEVIYPQLKAFWDEYLSAASEEQRKSLSARTCLFAARKCMQNLDYVLAYMSREEEMKIINFLLDEAARFAGSEGVEEVMRAPVLPLAGISHMKKSSHSGASK